MTDSGICVFTLPMFSYILYLNIYLTAPVLLMVISGRIFDRSKIFNDRD